LRLPLLVLLNLHDDAVQPYGFLLRGRNIGVDACRFAREGPVAPSDDDDGENEDGAAGDDELLTEQRRRLGLGFLALDGEQVDANHRSPALLSARPTATAAVAPVASRS